ncbi:MAG: histidinol-phosphate aminotransferase 2 [Verrucomicrobiota bacterium]|jgi:histidinol-phosphate aminotransferase
MSLPFQVNPCLANLPVYQPGRPVEEVARELGLDPAGVIKLASNENSLGPSPKAIAAMRDAVGRVHEYPDGSAFHLKRRLAEKLGVSSSNLILGNGSNEVLEFVAHACISPGSEVVVSEYCFAVYPIVTHLMGGSLVTVPARDYGHDLGRMLDAITDRTRVVFVANPNNPTGTHIPAGEVEAFLGRVPSSVLVVMDEAYIEYLDDPLDLVPWVLGGDKPNLLLTRTFSKIYGLAGLRLGYGVGVPEVISVLEKVRQPFNINLVAQAGALAALDDSDHTERTRENNSAQMSWFEEQLEALKLVWVPSRANFLLVRVGEGRLIFDRMQRDGVIVRPMGGYGLPEWIRISIGSPQENQRCVKALQAALAE